mmetsp:Transcript_124546/g.398400  ORF Transcript_124546/g.398400 Transcript_124546/m.398400 type:complete len:210 (+) Transcript_124546:1553-2182(+)
MHCALQLVALVRAAVVNGVAVGVAQDFLVGDGQLNDVAELAQGPTPQERQVAGAEDLRASTSVAGEGACFRLQASDVGTELGPKMAGVGIPRAAQVHEHALRAEQLHRVFLALCGCDAQLAAPLANPPQVPRVDQRHGLNARALGVHARRCGGPPGLALARKGCSRPPRPPCSVCWVDVMAVKKPLRHQQRAESAMRKATATCVRTSSV